MLQVGTLVNSALPCPVLPCLVLPGPVLPCPILPYLPLPCPCKDKIGDKEKIRDTAICLATALEVVLYTVY